MSDWDEFDAPWAGQAQFPSFDQWFTDIFERPAPWTDGGIRRPAGAWREEIEWMYDSHSYTGDDVLGHISRLFQAPALLLERCTEGQITEGLEWLCDITWYEGLLWLTEGDASDELRRKVIGGVGELYEVVLSRITKNAHPDEGASIDLDRPADKITFMFWDIVRTPGDDVVANAMEQMFRKVLLIDNGMCRAGALHGLGHWHRFQPDRVGRVIDEYLFSGRPMSDVVREYAEDAKRGQVL